MNGSPARSAAERMQRLSKIKRRLFFEHKKITYEHPRDTPVLKKFSEYLQGTGGGFISQQEALDNSIEVSRYLYWCDRETCDMTYTTTYTKIAEYVILMKDNKKRYRSIAYILSSIQLAQKFILECTVVQERSQVEKCLEMTMDLNEDLWHREFARQAKLERARERARKKRAHQRSLRVI